MQVSYEMVSICACAVANCVPWCPFNSKLKVTFNGSVGKYRLIVTVLAHAWAEQDRNLRQICTSNTFYEHYIDNQSQRQSNHNLLYKYVLFFENVLFQKIKPVINGVPHNTISCRIVE